jgi:hypothetical protein
VIPRGIFPCAVPLLGALMLLPAPAVAQDDPRGLELGLEGISALASPAFIGGGVSIAIRPGGQSRLVLALVPGSVDGRLAGRGELAGHLLLTPGRRHGVGFYGLAGIAGQVGPVDTGLLLVGLGVESAPGGAGGWHLEAGVGRGFRIAAGWRWRWLHRAGTTMP